MKLTLLLLGAILNTGTCLISSGVWKRVAENICFEARDSKYATFTYTSPSNVPGVTDVKLVHKSGLINCAIGNDNWAGHWGCSLPGLDKIPINVLMTDHHNNVLLPRNRFVNYKLHVGYWYALPGFDKSSKQLIWSDHANPLRFPTGDNQLRIWTGDDLKGWTEGDNSGKVCVDVFFHYCDC